MMLYSCEALKEWLGFKRDSRVVRWLQDNRIEHWYGQDGKPCTTEAMINASKAERPQEVRFA